MNMGTLVLTIISMLALGVVLVCCVLAVVGTADEAAFVAVETLLGRADRPCKRLCPAEEPFWRHSLDILTAN